MQDDQIRDALNAHWHASAIGDADAEHDIYADNVVCEYPQSGERIVGRGNLQAPRSHHPGRPSGFDVRRILGKGGLWITEYIINYRERTTFTVSIMNFRDGKVMHETQYFAEPFEARTGEANGFSGAPDTSPSAVIGARAHSLIGHATLACAVPELTSIGIGSPKTPMCVAPALRPDGGLLLPATGGAGGENRLLGPVIKRSRVSLW